MILLPCRVLPHESGDGPAHMALDEALLDSVAEDPTSAVLRTYEWSRPTLSLGYFQSIAEAEADPRWLGVPIVRRPTGGGALWHDREVTYAVVVPGDHPAARPSAALYRTVHRAIAASLREAGVEADRRGETPRVGGPTSRPFLCFADRDAEDIVAGTVKIVGSAQRRRSGAVLQHGSLLLARSGVTPELPGLADLVPVPAAGLRWARVLAEAIPRALGLKSEVDEVRPGERDRAERLRREVYEQSAWNRRR